ncbi:hypothetical protein KPSA3_00911 [Pseudomonas syringae pv. actinidiae]|uniref:Uncharacterized protein n=1 Tax=Pseudomonas syringae pv. actinidiae TaxID=103796 RepID=A0AAN4Q0D0_PSESF|nr:hypothetical protein KPSA3_00911 [Pseudomonas syringae pv. actinidiae]
MLVAPSGQSQLILVKNRADCRLGIFHFKVTPSVLFLNKPATG